MNDEPIIMDTPEKISLYRTIAMKKALKIELKTGMKASKLSIVQAVNRDFGTNFRTKRQAYIYLCELLPGDNDAL